MMRLTHSIRRVQIPLTPLEVFTRIREHSEKCFLLESIEGTEKTARYSFIGFDPIFEFLSKNERVWVNGESYRVKNPYKELKKIFLSFECGRVGTIPFSGGIVGHLSYDIVRYFESIPSLAEDDLRFPDSHFILPAHLLCWDHLRKEVYLISYKKEEEMVEDICRESIEGKKFSISRISTKPSKSSFVRSVIRAKEHIKDGDIFQVVLSRRLQGPFRGDPIRFYELLRMINPSPYMFYLDYGENKIIGSSPEMLVRLRDGELTLRPIAGTRPRGRTREEDEKIKLELILDEKERAEHLMLVDLGRNDLGRVAVYGSVQVDELMGIEKYSHVQHLVSNISARIREDMDGFDVLKATFPAGTVTGAPKIRAMEIIEDLERMRRGPYAGGVGYFDFSGNLDFAITIRSMFIRKNKAYFQAGAGIVADSDPEREFLETEQKLKASIRSYESSGYR